ncbi:hypothetical protein KO525_18545 [Psychrosphaera sp. B3R10]|uniref:hypothetical protein n=1 Tax=unclassified Psychrosphaera TaxID=2641570 RepID=UPI001C08AEF7|nr:MULTISPECIES: hypothetical protein [unclassified Psychrosphaera]MBU2882989.1 hypothetical protein [Psychrosphaera sp. I2R16]MBU2991386.1 hypothetical protein [Psychrosphaera sp. B3R10]MDO6720275.1 hypothetical protein [Psychrosphaera sp. 1_MG-2023]
MSYVKVILFISALISSGSLLANKNVEGQPFSDDETNSLSPESAKLLAQLKQTTTETILRVKNIEAQRGNSLSDFEQLLSSEPTRISDLGLVLDVQSNDNYFHIVGITPGSVAEKLGLNSGDKLFFLDDIPAHRSQLTAFSSFVRSFTDKQSIKLDVQQGGERKTLTAVLSVTDIPGFTLKLDNLEDQCGRIYTIPKARSDRTFFPLELRRIDGKTTQNFSGQIVSTMGIISKQNGALNSVRLKAGRHKLLFKSEPAARYTKKRPMFKTLHEKKEFTLDVLPNKNYLLAAEMINDNKEWQISVLEVSDANCELKWHDD